MKLKQYIILINEFAKQNPETLDFDVIFSSDDEGNSFHLINYPISKGHFSGYEYDTSSETPNSVCIN
jgi:hypothetical protein